MFKDEDKERILSEFLRNIWGISNKDYQNRIWIRGEGPECDDFTETVCYFFDLGAPLLRKYQEFGITDIQYQMLKKFSDEFRAFSDDNYWPPKFIDTPEWQRIVDMAKEVLKIFNYK